MTWPSAWCGKLSPVAEHKALPSSSIKPAPGNSSSLFNQGDIFPSIFSVSFVSYYDIRYSRCKVLIIFYFSDEKVRQCHHANFLLSITIRTSPWIVYHPVLTKYCCDNLCRVSSSPCFSSVVKNLFSKAVGAYYLYFVSSLLLYSYVTILLLHLPSFCVQITEFSSYYRF
jgi:hypothetical protein